MPYSSSPSNEGEPKYDAERDVCSKTLIRAKLRGSLVEPRELDQVD